MGKRKKQLKARVKRLELLVAEHDNALDALIEFSVSTAAVLAQLSKTTQSLSNTTKGEAP
jgi:uncharacterized coiled-coil protein SlyX